MGRNLSLFIAGVLVAILLVMTAGVVRMWTVFSYNRALPVLPVGMQQLVAPPALPVIPTTPTHDEGAPDPGINTLPAAVPVAYPTHFGEISGTVFDVNAALKQQAFGGAIATIGTDILIMSRRGAFAVLNPNDDSQTAQSTNISFENNYDLLWEHATSVGSNIKPDHMRFHDVAINPDASRLYVSVDYWHDADQCYTQRLISVEAPADIREASVSTEDWDLVYETSPCIPLTSEQTQFVGHQAGGKIAFLGSDILLTVGDYGYSGEGNRPSFPQEMDTSYGKTVRISSENDAILTSGHRNPQGLIVTRAGVILETEHGPQGGDELNVLTPGANYGWPHVTYGAEYGGVVWPWNENEQHSGYSKPLFAWVPSPAVSALVETVGFWDRWEGDILVGTLKAQQIRRLRMSGSDIVYDEPIEIGERIRDMEQAPSGAIVILTDSGKVIYLPPVSQSNKVAMAAQEAADPIKGCLECHSQTKGQPSVGAPNLHGVVGRDIASTDFIFYSDDLLALEGAWSVERLTQYLADPGAITPGSIMATAGQVKNADSRAAIVRYLAQLH